MAYRRFDAGALTGKGTPVPGGGVRVPAALTRTGVFAYKLTDGSIRRELRSPEEVFHPDSLRSLGHATVTDLHPPDGVNPDNWKTVSVGHVAENVAVQAPHVVSDLVIQDAGAIKLVDEGVRKELSCGYTCDLLDQPGTWQGEDYDAIQQNIRYNHVAMGPEGWGRAGPTVSLRLDGGDGTQVHQEQRNKPMKTIRIDGVDYEVGSDAHLAKIQDMHTKALEEKERAFQTEKGRADSLATKVTTLESELVKAKDPATFTKQVQARADLLEGYRRLDSSTFKAEKNASKEAIQAALKARADKAAGMNDLEMMGDMIKMIDPSFDAAGLSEDYVRGAFMALVKPALAKMAPQMKAGPEDKPASEGEGPSNPADKPAVPQDAAGLPQEEPGGQPPPGEEDPNKVKDSIFGARGGHGKPGEKPDPDAARARMVKDNRDAWRQPLHMSVKTG